MISVYVHTMYNHTSYIKYGNATLYFDAPKIQYQVPSLFIIYVLSVIFSSYTLNSKVINYYKGNTNVLIVTKEIENGYFPCRCMTLFVDKN